MASVDEATWAWWQSSLGRIKNVRYLVGFCWQYIRYPRSAPPKAQLMKFAVIAPWTLQMEYPTKIPRAQTEKSDTTNKLSTSRFCVPYSSQLWMRSLSIVRKSQIAKNTGSKIVPPTNPISVDRIIPAVSSRKLKLEFQFTDVIIYSTKSITKSGLVKKVHWRQFSFQAHLCVGI